MVVGRFAPSPTGQLHLGNLRTALVAWLSARAAGGRFVVRMEDLDRVTSSREHELAQLAELAAIGLDWDGVVVRQSERFERYERAIASLTAAGRTYECYCSRREIRDAASAPHGPNAGGRYPRTCRRLSDAEREEKRRAGRPPALRLLADGAEVELTDAIAGRYSAPVDDIVLRRNDGVPAYNLAVVVDDAAQGITEIVRGDDLLPSTPSQVHLTRLLGLPVPNHAHVPLVLAPDGSRLAKRHGAVTLEQLADRGSEPGHVLSRLAASLGLAHDVERVTATQLIERFDLDRLPRTPWRLQATDL
ncbi:MAG: tRNA glutamyl-Q(34) synthetase GluQRS [Acidimicrobiia bacterium]